MNSRTLSALFLFTLSSFGIAPAAMAGNLVFSEAGFQIAPLDVAPGETTITPLYMMLPPEKGFAANVNVQIQSFNGTIASYDKASLAEIKEAGFVMVHHAMKGKALIYEYTGSMNNRKLHWYSRIIISNQHVYLATATSLDALWSTYRKVLTATIESFNLN